MKKGFIVILFLLFLLGCGKSEEEKINDIIATSVKNTLYFPDSYDPIETEKVEKDVRLILNDKNLDMATYAYRLVDEIDKTNDNIKHYTRGIKYGIDYRSELRYELDSRKIHVNTLNDIVEEYREDFKRMIYDTDTINRTENIYVHKYRAKNNAGLVTIGENVIILNKEKDKVIKMYDTSSNEFMYLTAILSVMPALVDDDDEIKNGYELLKVSMNQLKYETKK